MNRTSDRWTWPSCVDNEEGWSCSFDDPSRTCIWSHRIKAGSSYCSTQFNCVLWGRTCLLWEGSLTSLVSSCIGPSVYSCWAFLSDWLESNVPCITCRKKSRGTWTLQRRLKQLAGRRMKVMPCSKWENMQGLLRDTRRYKDCSTQYIIWMLFSIHFFLGSWWVCFLIQAAKFIEYDSSFSDEEKKQAKALKVTCNLNNAACKLKLKDYKQAEKLCTKVFLRLFKLLCFHWSRMEISWGKM